LKKEYYLDNGATTRPYEEVVDLVANISKNCYGNSSSLHTKGIEAERIINQAKEDLANILGVKPSEIYFTSGGTESNNMAISGSIMANRKKGKHLITTKIEHSAVLEVFKHYEAEGYETDFISVDESGKVNVDELLRAIRKDTVLVSVMAVNNETGCIQPIKEIGDKIKTLKDKPLYHVDAVQAFGKMSIKPQSFGADLLSISGHKFHGPKGVGVLYIKTGTKIEPVMWGGGHQGGMRSGTMDTPGIAGLALAAKMVYSNLDATGRKISELRRSLLDFVKDKFKDAVIHSEHCSLDHIVSISFPNVKGEVLLHHLEAKGIYVSTGSACSSSGKSKSHVLKAMGVAPELLDGTIRISFSEFNEQEDIEKLKEALEEIIPVITIKNRSKVMR
jgi:cysteine desulfurase